MKLIESPCFVFDHSHVTQTTSWTHPVTSAVGGADREPGGHVVDTPIETET